MTEAALATALDAASRTEGLLPFSHGNKLRRRFRFS